MKFVNLTGRTLRFLTYDDPPVIFMTLPSRGQAVMQSDTVVRETVKYHDHYIAVVETTEQAVLGLPDPEPDTLFIVSGLVASAVDREDVVAPASVVRDPETRRIVGARQLIKPRPMGRL